MTQEWPPGPCPLPAQTPGSWAGGAMQPSVPSGHCCETLRSTPRFRSNSSVSRSSPPPSYPGRSCWRRALRRRRGTPLLEPAGLTLTPLTGTCPPPTQAPRGRQSGPPWPSALDTHSAPWAWTPHQQGIRRPGTPLVLEPLVSPTQNAQVDLPVSSALITLRAHGRGPAAPLWSLLALLHPPDSLPAHLGASGSRSPRPPRGAAPPLSSGPCL